MLAVITRLGTPTLTFCGVFIDYSFLVVTPPSFFSCACIIYCHLCSVQLYIHAVLKWSLCLMFYCALFNKTYTDRKATVQLDQCDLVNVDSICKSSTCSPFMVLTPQIYILSSACVQCQVVVVGGGGGGRGGKGRC